VVHPAENYWYSVGENPWIILAENCWYIVGRKLTRVIIPSQQQFAGGVEQRADTAQTVLAKILPASRIVLG
jgi:hypothetical protein